MAVPEVLAPPRGDVPRSAELPPPDQTESDPGPALGRNAPPWADTSCIDEECVIHRRTIGEVRPEHERDPIRVDLARFDELSPPGAPTTPSPANVCLNGVLLTPAEARDLCGLLGTALELIR